jgi:hypothetical protein
MNKLFVVFFFLISTINLFSQSIRSAGMGCAYTALSNDVFSNIINPAGTSKIGDRSISAAISPSPYGLNELQTMYIGYAEPFTFGNIQITVSSYGFDLFKKYITSICYAKTFINNFSLGLNLHYDYYNIKNYGSSGLFGVDIGTMIDIISGLNWGMSLSNINSPELGNDNDKTEQLFKMGLSYSPIKEFIMDIDIQKDLKYPANICFGFDYHIASPFSIRAGINTEPAQYSFGFGLLYLNFILDYAIILHNELGASHMFSISYNFSN